MRFPKKLKYTREHEWVVLEASIATVGITDFAQDQLGEIVFVELPAEGDTVIKDESFGVVESVKAASDIYAPLSGDVTEINTDLVETPELLNDDPYGDAWLIRLEMSDTAEIKELMTSDEYRAYVKEEGDVGEIEDSDDDEDSDE